MKLLITLSFLFIMGCNIKNEEAHYNQHIDQLMKRHEKEISACYLGELKRNPNMGEGTLRVYMDQDSDGGISNIVQIGHFKGCEPVFDCIIQNVSQWKFDPTYLRGGVNLSWNFKKTNSISKN